MWLKVNVVDLKKKKEIVLLFSVQLCSEFHRITNQNLLYSLFAALDKYTPQLLCKKRKNGSFGKKIQNVLMAYEEQVNIFFFNALHWCWMWTELQTLTCIPCLCATGQEQHRCSSNSSPGRPTNVLKGGFIRGLQNLQGIAQYLHLFCKEKSLNIKIRNCLLLCCNSQNYLIFTV